MKVFVNLIIMMLAATAGLAIGFLWHGRNASTASAETPTTGSVAMVSRTSRFSTRNRPATMSFPDSPLATQLARDLSMSSGVTRWLLWMEAVEKASLADFPRLAQLAAGDSTRIRLLAAKWVELNPQHLFEYIMATTKGGRAASVTELTSVLMEEWPKRDLEGAIAAANGTNDLGLRRQWRMQMATAVFDKDVERGLRLFSEWNIENYSPRMNAVAKWAASNPQHAAAFTLANPAGYASQSVMETVGKEWAKIDPAAALAYATSQRGDLATRLATTTLKEWAGRDLQAAAQWLSNADTVTRERLSAPFIEAWAKTDANAAFAWCESNLAGTAQERAVTGVFKGAAAKNVTGAAEGVLAMEPSAARTAAAVAVAEKWFPSYGSDKSVAPETLAWISKLDVASARKVLENLQWRWSDSDPKAMAAFLATLSSEQIPENGYSTLARSMARKNPVEAIQWASQLPSDHSLSAATDAFQEWQRSQPDVARKWVTDLPASDSRRPMLFHTAISTLAHSPDAIEQLATLNLTDRAAAQGIIQNMASLQEERRARLLTALKQP